MALTRERSINVCFSGERRQKVFGGNHRQSLNVGLFVKETYGKDTA